MRVCPSCGHENPPDVDFCTNCGQYVRWEPTRLATAVPAAPEASVAAPDAPAAAPPAPPVAAPPGDGHAAPGDGDGHAAAAAPPAAGAPPPAAPAGGGTMVFATPLAEPPAPDVPPDSILLALRVPGLELPPEAEIETDVAPGGTALVMALVRNQSGIVDNYDVSIEGLPDTWWSASPPTIYLVPYGASSGTSEQEVTLTINPPRAPDAEARPWQVKVVISSRAHGVVVGVAPATINIGPYYELDSEMRPERKGGVRRARFAVAARNKGNAAFDVNFTALDPENICTFEFEHPQVPTRPGRRNGSVFWVKPQKQMIFGRKVDRRFTLETKAVGTDAAALPRMGVYTQKPWLPWWLLILVPLLLALLIAAYLLWPRNVTVPNVRECGNLRCAQSKLENVGLKLGATSEKKTDERVPGSPIASNPGTGRKVKKGTAIDVVLAVGTGNFPVPDLTGMTLEEALEELRGSEGKFQPGQLRPDPGDDRTAKIRSQVPKPDTRAAEGSTVDLFFTVAQTTTATTTGTGTGTTTTGPGTTTGGLPGGTGDDEGDDGGGDQTTTTPRPGTPAAYAILFDNDRDILAMGAETGKPVKTIIKSDDFEDQPAVAPDGSLIAYERGPKGLKTQIWVVDPKELQFAAAATKAGSHRDHRPAFSPDGKVIAFVRTKLEGDKEGDSDICFIRANAAQAVPSCIVDPNLIAVRPTWAPDGRAIAVLVAKAPKAGPTDLAMYTSRTANSGNARTWNNQGVVTDKLAGKKPTDFIAHAEWRPGEGDQIAITTTAGTSGAALSFHVMLIAAKDGALDPNKVQSLVRVRACELAWRPDGKELAIVVRDNLCDPRKPGIIQRFDPTKPNKLTPLTKVGIVAANPIWAPVAILGD